MAGTAIEYYRNYDSSDTTANSRYSSNDPLPTIEACGWEPPSGYQFKEWNTKRDGSGLSFQPGDTISGGSPGYDLGKYAIWEPAPIPYLVTSTDLTSIADAIRTKGGTAASLTYPAGFVSAINAIPTGGGDEYTITNNSGDTVDMFLNVDGHIDTTTVNDGDDYPYQAGAIAVVFSPFGTMSVSGGEVESISPDGSTIVFVMPDFDVALTM